ncbi:uncharacterized protein LOC108678524 isoform X2 [Hyalella azteca]|uniref:E3 ubiquitin-protein ligase RNF10 n=1 Tax=Hyalella azteca TaxID=294128 RepID=A0A8B7P925_HYAAZ|nr:uncharacterized protein LOC108678524 isoform X2 [Hyalella azteca]
MDQTTSSAAMDSRKPVVRSAQLGSKLPNQDSSRELCKRSNGGGRRQQRDWERDSLVATGIGGGCGGGGRGKCNGWPNKPGYGRPSNKTNRIKEKEGGQVKLQGWRSSDHYDDEEYYESSGRQLTHQAQGGGFTRSRHARDITHTLHWDSYGGQQASKRNYKTKLHQSSGALFQNRTKERFLQARCQFLVNYKMEAKAVASAALPVGFTPPASASTPAAGIGASGEARCSETDMEKTSTALVTAALSDPDTLVSWGAIEEVRLHMTQPTNCPVCLYEPVAPKVTRCGHIYCYPCILHYLALSDKKWRSCPICYEMVVREDLKSVVCVVHPDYGVGTSIEMRLMRKHKQSAVPEPVHCVPPDTALSQQRARRTLQATPAKVLEILARERTALEVQMVAEGSEPEACFIEQALALIAERELSMPDFGFEEQDQLARNMSHLDLHNTINEVIENSSPCTAKDEENVSYRHEDGVITSDGNLKKLNVHYASSPVENIHQCEPQGKEGRHRSSSGSSSVPSASSDDPASVLGPGVTSITSADSPKFDIARSRNNSDDTSSVSSSASNELVFGEISREIDNVGLVSDIADGGSVAELPCDFIANNIAAESLHFELEDDVPETNQTVKKKEDANAPKLVQYFYQASDGSHVYLNHLNMRMLTSEYGGVEGCPPTIRAKILEKEYGLVDEDVRKRIKFLGHLPLCCSYELVELDLHPPLVSQETLRQFRCSLHRREVARDLRAKQEQQIELRNRLLEEKELEGRRFLLRKSAFTSASVADGVRGDGGGGGVGEFTEEDYPLMSTSSSTGGRSHRQSVSSDGRSSPGLATSPVNSTSLPDRRGKPVPPKQAQQQQLTFAKMLTTQSSSGPQQAWPSVGEISAPAWPRAARAAGL